MNELRSDEYLIDIDIVISYWQSIIDQLKDKNKLVARQLEEQEINTKPADYDDGMFSWLDEEINFADDSITTNNDDIMLFLSHNGVGKSQQGFDDAIADTPRLYAHDNVMGIESALVSSLGVTSTESQLCDATEGCNRAIANSDHNSSETKVNYNHNQYIESNCITIMSLTPKVDIDYIYKHIYQYRYKPNWQSQYGMWFPQTFNTTILCELQNKFKKLFDYNLTNWKIDHHSRVNVFPRDVSPTTNSIAIENHASNLKTGLGITSCSESLNDLYDTCWRRYCNYVIHKRIPKNEYMAMVCELIVVLVFGSKYTYINMIENVISLTMQ